MSTHPASRRWTYEDFARLPNDGQRYEVIGGELFVTPSPTRLHQRVVTNIGYELEGFAREQKLGEVYIGPYDVLFGEGDYVAPDVIFVRKERLHILRKRGAEGPPDLVVEVLSDKTAARDRKLKRERYAHFGVPEYWIVDPIARRIEVHRTTDDKARRTEIVTDTLTWEPVVGRPVLTLSVPELIPVLEDDES